MTTPTYAVITAYRNASQTIKRCINSVLKQDPPPKQYVLVDGASIDGSQEVVEQVLFKEKHSRLKTSFDLIRENEAGGISKAWNVALQKVTADIVFILNSDDWYESDTARIVLSAFNAKPRPDIVHGKMRSWICHSTSMSVHRVVKPRTFALLPVLMPINHCACFVHRCVYDRIGLFEEGLRTSMDYDFIYRCHAAKIRFYYVPVILTNFSTGGFANSNRRLAREETLSIALRHGAPKILALSAYALRSVLGR
ncbi:MAG: glycosyltransferase [Chloroflexota bacterium]